jgi:hypothetical protein
MEFFARFIQAPTELQDLQLVIAPATEPESAQAFWRQVLEEVLRQCLLDFTVLGHVLIGLRSLPSVLGRLLRAMGSLPRAIGNLPRLLDFSVLLLGFSVLSSAEERARQAEERARLAEERARQAEERARQAEERARQAEERARQVEELAMQNRTCVICLFEEKCYMLNPCGHICVCQMCTQRLFRQNLARCPICREIIRVAVRVYI